MKKHLLCMILALALLLGVYPAAGAAYTEMAFSDDLVEYIKAGEGFREKPYADPSGWYIGYGCACNPLDYPNGITEEGAEALLREKMQLFADDVNNRFLKKYGITVTQGQFDAMCAMSYALGPSWLKAGNRLPDYLINGIENYTDQQIGAAFAAWCHVGGKVNSVALQRRIMETKMFLDDDYSHTADGWNWLVLDANGGENELSDVTVYRSGAPYGVLPKATRSGYYFAGWQTVSGMVLKTTDIVSENLNVTAVWSTTPAAEPAPEQPSAPTEETPPAEPAPAEPAEPYSVFPDVPDGRWFAPYVNDLADAGVVNGYPDGTFGPEKTVTWGEALKLIVLASGFAEQAPPDTESGAEKKPHWAQGYFNFAVKKGYFSGSVNQDLDRPITRNEIADLTAAAMELDLRTGGKSPYADSSRASAAALYAAGIMEGSFDAAGNRNFKGADKISRAEICAVLTRVRAYVEEHFVFVGYNRVPIDFDLNFNSYDTSAFRTGANGRVYYDGTDCTVRYGIDVSYHQGDIDWQKVAADGIDFAIIRCGYRGYSKGALGEDECYRANIEGALAAGLDVGVYFFSQALNEEEALEEAEYTLELIRGYDITFPVVFDWEQMTNTGSRSKTPNWRSVGKCTKVFCDTVAAAGYTPMTYFNVSMAYLSLDLSLYQNYPEWLAYYHEAPKYIYDYQMWQYGSSGSVAGISGRCDMDIAFVDFAA